MTQIKSARDIFEIDTKFNGDIHTAVVAYLIKNNKEWSEDFIKKVFKENPKADKQRIVEELAREVLHVKQ